MTQLDRRTFLAGTSASLALATGLRAGAGSSQNNVVLALMGANNRGSQLAQRFMTLPGVEFAYVCDPDERAVQKGIKAATAEGRRSPQGIRDFRKALDDPAVDGLVCAAPNHWHAAATVLACAAGKHVYVEKPACQTPQEGEWMIEAARSNNRVVQVGMQRRSGDLYQQAVQRIQEGELGDVLYGKSWYYHNRPTIGHGQKTATPDWLDYSLWQGPAPERPYQDNLIHYNWHFFWHWGNGELGNNGVHTIDICRWAMGVEYPSQVTVSGSRLRYDDDQETPDTCLANFACQDKTIVWEGLSWTPPKKGQPMVGIEFRGEKGMMFLTDQGFTIIDNDRNVIETAQGSRGDSEHLENFLNAIRDGESVLADIEEGHKSALFCHLGNIAYRTSTSKKLDNQNGHIQEAPEAQTHWTREYRKGWTPEV